MILALFACGGSPSGTETVGTFATGTVVDAALPRDAALAQLGEEVIDPDAWLLPEPPTDGDWSRFPQDPACAMTDARVALGRQLFYEPGLAAGFEPRPGYKEVSCATCHDPRAGFGSGIPGGRGLGRGAEGELAGRRITEGLGLSDVDYSLRNERRIVNAAWGSQVASWPGDFDATEPAAVERPMLDTGHDALEAYIWASLGTHMAYEGNDRAAPVSSAAAEPEYDALFAAAWPELDSELRTSRETVAATLGTFVRSIVTTEAPFQVWLRTGDDTGLTDQDLDGAVLFFGEARCARCHEGPGLTKADYSTLGTRAYDPAAPVPGLPSLVAPGEEATVGELATELPDNSGHGRLDGDPADSGAFRIPSAYGGGDPAILAWGHGAAHTSLDSFLRHKTGGNDPEVNGSLDVSLLDSLDPILYDSAEPLVDEDGIAALVAFVSHGLQDESLSTRYGPPQPLSLAGYCVPSNDAVTRAAHAECAEARVGD